MSPHFDRQGTPWMWRGLVYGFWEIGGSRIVAELNYRLCLGSLRETNWFFLRSREFPRLRFCLFFWGIRVFFPWVASLINWSGNHQRGITHQEACLALMLCGSVFEPKGPLHVYQSGWFWYTKLASPSTQYSRATVMSSSCWRTEGSVSIDPRS